MLLRLTYLGVTNAFALLRLLPISDHDKDTEILALRHQITVLQRQLAPHKLRFAPADRAFSAALLHRLSRPALRTLRLLIRPDRLALAPRPHYPPPRRPVLSQAPKVAGPSGWAWADGSQMRRQVAMDRIRKDVYGSDRGITMAHALYPHSALFTTFAASALALELGAPLGMLNGKAGRLWAVSTFGMHWGIRAIMGIRFRYQLSGASFAPWFNLERLPLLPCTTRTSSGP